MAQIGDHPLVSDQINRDELWVILRELTKVLTAGVPGDVAELGCYVGTTSLFLQRVLRQYAAGKTLHVYDSFAGLPPKHSQDASPLGEQFKAGELAARKSDLVKNFRQAGLPLPVIHKAWFQDLTPADLPDRLCFAFLDGDFYQSIMSSLRVVWPKLTPGAVVVIDDYHTETLPGVRHAVDAWARDHRFTVRAQASLAIIRPQN